MDQKKKEDQTKKKPVPPPPRVGRKKKGKGVDASSKLPVGTNIFYQSHSNHQMQIETTQIVKNQRLFTHGTINY